MSGYVNHVHLSIDGSRDTEMVGQSRWNPALAGVRADLLPKPRRQLPLAGLLPAVRDWARWRIQTTATGQRRAPVNAEENAS